MKKRKKNPAGGKRPKQIAAPEAPTQTPGDIQPSRRRFLNRIWLILAAIGVVEFGVMLIHFFRPRKPQAGLPEAKTRITVGRISDFRPGSVTAYPQGRFYLVCLEDGGFMALSRQCTHLGCTVPWDAENQQFACPCHASVFDITGGVINAPAPRPLDRFPVTIENEWVHVDFGQRIRRGQFRDDQVVYAKNDNE